MNPITTGYHLGRAIIRVKCLEKADAPYERVLAALADLERVVDDLLERLPRSERAKAAERIRAQFRGFPAAEFNVMSMPDSQFSQRVAGMLDGVKEGEFRLPFNGA